MELFLASRGLVGVMRGLYLYLPLVLKRLSMQGLYHRMLMPLVVWKVFSDIVFVGVQPKLTRMARSICGRA